MSRLLESPLSRRDLFSCVGRLGVAAALLGSFSQVSEAHADVDAVIRDTFGSSDVSMGNVTIDAPIIAENGRVVPIKVRVDHAMEADNYIDTIAIIIDGNPKPLAATYHLTPKSGKAQITARVKMGKTSKVRAIARTNKGKLLGAISEVKVTIGGCGG